MAEGMLEGKVVIVSGAGPGLGREVAAVALREGARVVLGARTEAKLQAVAGEIDPGGDRVAWKVTDICDAASCQALADLAAERFGGLHALVNVAARDADFGGLRDADFDVWRAVMETNVIGTLQMTRAAVKHLEGQGGAVVLIGSQSMFLPQVNQTAYASSKGALFAAMYSLAHELGPARVRVNTVVPTWMWGPPVEMYFSMTAKAQGVPAEELIGQVTSRMPLGEIPADGDVAEAVAFLASDRSRMITGQTLFVNSGELLH